MFWYFFLGALAGIFGLSVILPVPRRLWAFVVYSLKYFWLWVFDRIGLRRLFVRQRPYEKLTRPKLIRMFCEDMGPTFIKFGQIIASSAGLFPDAYVQEFQKVLDRVKPFPFDDVKRTLIAELGHEKAAHLIDIEPKPLASASIAQVHTANLKDGTPVVVKVQRPGIASRCAADMKIMLFFARVYGKLNKDAELVNPVGVVEDFAGTLMEELDFRKEAANLDRFEEIKRRGIDGETKLVDGLRAWFQCVVFYGFFHGDVHAGNLMLLDDDTLGFLDFGIVGRFDDRERYLVTDYMIAFASGNYRRLAEIICEMAGTPANLDMDGFVKDLGETYRPLLTLSFGEVNYAEFLPGIQRTATRHRVRMPNEFILITKQLLYFDRYAKALAPRLNVFTDPRLVLGMMQDIQKARMQASAAKPS